MARIRTIKPEFPQSESMGNISRESRLCFIMLWTIADDSGRLRGNSRMLASLLYPYDSDADLKIDGWLDELDAQKCLVRYKVDGHSYLQILNWLNHQKIDKPSKSKYPEFDESSRILAKVREGSSGDQGPRTKEGNGPEEGLSPSSPEATTEKLSLQVFPDIWNQLCGALPKIEKFTESRKKKVKARVNQGIRADRFSEAVKACVKKPFLRGENERGWVATFDWLVDNDRNIEKAITQPYGENQQGAKTNGKLDKHEQMRKDVDELFGSEDDRPRVN